MDPVQCFTAYHENPHDPGPFLTCLAHAIQQVADEVEDGGHACIVVNYDQQRGNVAEFTKRNASRFEVQGVTCHVYTMKKLPPQFHGWPVVALWIKEDGLAELEHRRAGSIYSVPYIAEHSARWVRAKQATDLMTGDTPDAPTISAPIVAVAASWIDSNCEGVIDPYERSYIVRVFQRLHAAHERWDETEIRAWLVSQGWDAKGADGVEDIARRTAEGRKLKAPHCSPLPPNTVDEWRKAADAQSDRDAIEVT